MKKITCKTISLILLIVLLTILTISSVKSQELTKNVEEVETETVVEETVEETVSENSVVEIKTKEESISEETIEEIIEEVEEIPEYTIIPKEELEMMVKGTNMEDIVDISDHKYSYEEMKRDIALLNYKYPDYLELSSIGTSLDNRELYQVIIGNPDAEKAIFVMSTIHGREWMNTWILMESLEMNLDNWNEPITDGETYGEALNDCCIYFIPMVNPDGVSISQFGLDAIKDETLRTNISTMRGSSNPARWKSNANGVDLNRQFSVGWNNQVDVTAPGADFYNGTAPFTEPEAIAIRDALEQREFNAAITYHSMEGAVYWDLWQEGELREENKTLAKLISKETGYFIGEAATSLRGLEYNYIVHELEIPSVLVETGRVQCPLPYSQFNILWKENKDILITVASYY